MLEAKEVRVRDLAYKIWEREHRPLGHEDEHWFMAERMDENVNGLAEARSAAQAISAYGRAIAHDVADGHDSLSGLVTGEFQKMLDRMVTTFGKLAKAKTPVEVAQVYTEHLTEMMHDNARQVVEVGQIVARAHTNAWAPFASVRTINGHGRTRVDEAG